MFKNQAEELFTILQIDPSLVSGIGLGIGFQLGVIIDRSDYWGCFEEE